MAGSLPVLKPREVAALLERLGFVEIRQRGSHRQYRHADGRGTTVPFHGSRDVSPTLLRKIARDIGLTVEERLRQDTHDVAYVAELAPSITLEGETACSVVKIGPTGKVVIITAWVEEDDAV